MFIPQHFHMMFKLKSLNPLVDAGEAKYFLKQLVYNINMNPVTEPQAVFVEDLGNEGLTGSINLATSHIAFHHWMGNGLLMLDVYSCCSFELDTVIKVIDSYWTLDKDEIRVIELDRNDDSKYTRYIP